MKLHQLTIEELVELRTKMILEKKSTKEINLIIEKKEKEYIDSLMEDGGGGGGTAATGGPGGAVASASVGFGGGGVAMGNAAHGGMGNVTAAQPSTMPGATIGSAWSGHGGTIGSGDVANPFPGGGNVYQKSPAMDMGKSHGARTGKKKRVKKLDLKALKNTFATKQDFTQGSEHKSKIMNFNDFQKQGVNKVTKVKESLDNEYLGDCEKCDTKIYREDCYSGEYQCPNCDHAGKIYELRNFKP
jgi:hypothetical protein